MKRLISTVLAVLMNVFIISNAFASGFAIYTQGASSLGQGAATIAHGDDPSVIFFNPALMNKLQGTQIQLGTTLLFPKRKFESDISGEVFKAKRDIFYPSTFYITHKFNEKVSGGIGLFNPFGLATEWPDDWPGRYITTKAEMTTYNINPVVSIQIIPEVSIAAGLNFLWLDASLEKNINLAPDGKQRFEGDGSGVGYNLGILIEPHKDISIGASYRSEIHVDIDGKISHRNVPPALTVLFPNTKGKTDITLPAILHAAMYYKGFNPLTFEIGMRWEGWSSYDRLKINFDQPILGQPFLDDPKNWKDTYSFNLGAKYQLNDSVSLLAGYLYSGNPVPDETFEPSIPDSNTHLFTLGTSIKQKRFKIDMAYGFQILESRKKDNTIGDPINPTDPNLRANGEYKSHLHMLGLSFTYLF
jgi:long-chain fatty acid transport protein